MHSRFLLPGKYKAIGWLISIPAFILMMFVMYRDFTFPFLNYHSGGPQISYDRDFLFDLQSHNFTGELAGVALITGLLMIALSKEKQEDEWIARVRLESMLWAVYVNSALLILSIIFLYNGLFLQVMVYNMCTPVILFIARFNLRMYSERKKLKKEDL